MTDFDKVTVSSDGKELLTLEPEVEEHDAPVGGRILCHDLQGKVHISLSAARAQFGGSSIALHGGFRVFNTAGKSRVLIHGGDELQNEDRGTIVLKGSHDNDTVSLGGGDTGDLYLRNDKGEFTLALRAVENALSGIWAGGHRHKGLLILRNGRNMNTVSLGGGDTGDLYLCNADGQFTVALRAVENDVTGIWIGGGGQNGHIVLRNAEGGDTIHLDGKAGDIILENADCAEEFEIASSGEIAPGTVMVLDRDGRLEPSAQPYDRRVAGIVSGAGGFRPAIVLGHRPGAGSRVPIALTGRVACNVDAERAPIMVGDLLTTSATPGHAMKAEDPQQAFGAVLGKALAPLPSGRGEVPVLVALQ